MYVSCHDSFKLVEVQVWTSNLEGQKQPEEAQSIYTPGAFDSNVIFRHQGHASIYWTETMGSSSSKHDYGVLLDVNTKEWEDVPV